MIKSGIYKITSPSNKIYIGQAVDLLKREKSYKRASCVNQPKIYQSILKYGWNAHSFEILEICNEESLNYKEQFYIQLYDTFNTPHGLNLQSGGEHARPSDETRKKISQNRKGKCKGRKLPKEQIDKIRQANSSKSIEEKQNISRKISIAGKGRKMKEESVKKGVKKRMENGVYNLLKIKMKGNQYAKGNKFSEEWKEKNKLKKAKSILQFNLDGTFVNKFQSARDATVKLNKDGNLVVLAAIGRTPSAYGFLWQYENDTLDGKVNWDKIKKKQEKKKLFAFDLNKNLLGEFDSVEDAATYFNIGKRGIEFSIMKGNIVNKRYIFSREPKIDNVKQYKERDKKKIYQFDINGSLIKVWDKGQDIKDSLGIDLAGIRKVCLGQRNNAGGFIWSYTDKI